MQNGREQLIDVECRQGNDQAAECCSNGFGTADLVDCATPAASFPDLSQTLARFDREAVAGVCDTGHYRCPYYVWGTGPPILFIPGMADDAGSFQLVISLLAGHFRCIAYDLPTGQGDGARLSSYVHAHYVDDAFALLDHLNIAQTYVFGSSFGSTIALAALRSQPKRLLRGILQGGFARRRLSLAEVVLARLGRQLPGSMHRLPLRNTALRLNHQAHFDACPADIWSYFVLRSNSLPIAAMTQRALLIHQIDLRPVLSEIRQPILLICGDADPLVGPSCEAELLKGLPNAGRIELPHCGHVPLFTHPNALAEITRRFLTPAKQENPSTPGLISIPVPLT